MISKIIKQSPFIRYADTQIFHNFSKTHSFENSLDLKIEEWPKAWTETYYKSYPRFKRQLLPPPLKTVLPPLNIILRKRSSIRSFSKKPISIQNFSTLLYYSFGKKYSSRSQRFYASAGARYPVEVYPIVFNVNGINPGIYHYHIQKHALEYLWSIKKDKILECFDQNWVNNASALFVLTGVFWRTEMKYQRRGYRYVMIDSGHMCQNTYLVATALSLGCCSIGGFIDDNINKILDIDGIEESAIVVVALGKKPKGGEL